MRIVSKRGEGGMGEVWRATDTKLNRDVAIKISPASFAEDAARMQRFEREAQVLASLNHPNIASIYGIEQGANVMELVDGARPPPCPVPPDTAIAYAPQIEDGGTVRIRVPHALFEFPKSGFQTPDRVPL